MKITFYILFFILAINVQAQTIFLGDIKTKEGIDGAVISLQSLKSNRAINLVTENGKIDLSSDWLPALVSVNHLSYEPLVDTIFSLDQFIYLHPSKSFLNEVVVTGQFSPQSVRNSVYQVRTIDQHRIKSQGATNLQTVLQNELNMRFDRDNALGSSRLNIQGISGQNVKVLIDGIPVVGRSGVANEIDLSQLNINSIEKIEIVEGPMAVMYGADALAGVINVITKKSSGKNLELNVTLHEETIGREYSLFSDGIHNPYLQLGANINDQWYLRVEGGINYNGGWQGDSEGRDKLWHPKSQNIAAGLLSYTSEKFEVFYRSDYLHEVITDLGQEVRLELRDPYALDEKFISSRWMQQLQAEWRLAEKSIINSALSFTNYERISKPFTKNLLTLQEDVSFNNMDTVFYRSLFTRNTFLQKLGQHEMQLGMDATLETAGGTTLSSGAKYLNDLGVFLSAELQIGKVKIRPGIRHTFNSVFETTPTPSINLKYDFSKKLSLRLGYGRGFRAPSIRELYHEFIDTNHNLIGNPNLQPEYSNNFNGDLAFQVTPAWQLNLAGFYNQINNRIAILLPEQADRPWTYTNQDQFKTTGFTIRSELGWKSLTMQTGFAHTGRFQLLSEEHEFLPGFVFSPEINQNMTYSLDQFGLSISSFYKFTGAFQDYRLIENVPQLRQINPFHWLDLTATKSIGNYLDITLGARNLLNITAVDNNMPGGVHSGNQDGSAAIANGRSYFVRLNFNLNLD